jgi:serpin B
MASFPRGLLAWSSAALCLSGCLAEPKCPDSATPEESSCAPRPAPGVEAPGELLHADEPRVRVPSASDAEVAALVAANTDFGVDVYRLSPPGNNLFFSPYSITQALAMVYVGARGETERQMAQALRFPLAQERLHPAMNTLDLALQTRSDPEGAPELHAVNALWGQQGYGFEYGFLDVLARQYGAGLRAVDFTANPEGLRQDINAWVESQTHGRIQELVGRGGVDAATRLVLVNALDFQGAWAQPFSSHGTRDMPFHPLAGGTRDVRMMSGGSGSRMTGEGFSALALSYVGGDFRMLLVVPDAGRFAEVEARLSARFLEDIRSRLMGAHLDVNLPRFQVDSALPLEPTLRALGMKDAFASVADFSGMSRTGALEISSVNHKGFVAVDEAGTVASAATEVSVGAPSVPEPFVVDRPFFFTLEHVKTGSVLFLGRVVSP